MRIQLPPALEALVQERVASGLYRDESEVIAEALRNLETSDGWNPDWSRLGPALDKAEADLGAGRYVEIQSVRELRALERGRG